MQTGWGFLHNHFLWFVKWSLTYPSTVNEIIWIIVSASYGTVHNARNLRLQTNWMKFKTTAGITFGTLLFQFNPHIVRQVLWEWGSAFARCCFWSLAHFLVQKLPPLPCSLNQPLNIKQMSFIAIEYLVMTSTVMQTAEVRICIASAKSLFRKRSRILLTWNIQILI